MKDGICPHCGKEVAIDYRVGFRETCRHCDGDLHCCMACEFYDPGYHNDCRETRAPMVADKDRANRCEWFAWGGNRGGDDTDDAARAKDALEALFKK